MSEMLSRFGLPVEKNPTTHFPPRLHVAYDAVYVVGLFTMSTSKYFSPSTRPSTRSAGQKALVALKEHKVLSRRKHVKVEYENEGKSNRKPSSENDSFVPHESDTSSKKAKTEVWMPERWREQLDNIMTMRESKDAPVDSMGCERTADMTASPEVINTIDLFAQWEFTTTGTGCTQPGERFRNPYLVDKSLRNSV